MNTGSNNGSSSTASRVFLAIRTRSTNTKLMAGLDLTERKLAEIGLNVVVIIHDLVQLSRVAQSLLLKKLCQTYFTNSMRKTYSLDLR